MDVNWVLNQPNEDDINFFYDLLKHFEQKTNVKKEGIIFIIETFNHCLLEIENLKHDPEVGRALLELYPNETFIIIANGYIQIPIHISEFINIFVKLCLDEFGGLALYTINKWNINTTKDIGKCLAAFIESGQFIKYINPEKIVDKFENLVDFNDVLNMEKYVSSLPIKE